MHDFERRFGLRVIAGYALSDYGFGASLSPDAPPEKSLSLGRTCEGVAIRVVDEDDLTLPAGQVGEIVMRIEQPGAAPLGYYKMPEATLAAWRNLWFHTGDRGYFDADGYLYLTDRKKDMIRRRGENISSYEVESVIALHPAVLQVAVYPLQSEHSEDEVAVTVMLKDGQALDPDELVAFCQQQMAAHMVPRFVEFVDAMPLTPTNKIEKYKIKERAQADRSRLWDREGTPGARPDRKTGGRNPPDGPGGAGPPALYWRLPTRPDSSGVKLKPAPNSIFAILLRSSWWISAAIALVLIASALASTRPTFTAVLFFAALPFLVIAAMAAWKQRNVPSAARVERATNAARAMPWETFSKVLQEGLRQDGCEVTVLQGGPADYVLRRKNRLAVVGAKRWKASRVGVQALQELNAVRETHGAHDAIYVTIGEISAPALAYAKANQIQFMAEAELTRLLPQLST